MAKLKVLDEKTKSLQQHGTLHPHPSDVEDDLFRGSDFFDRRDLVQVRYEMLRRVRIDGRPTSEVAARFGISRPTYYKASADFEREGLAGLVPRKRGPREGHKLTEEAVVALEHALEQDPSLDSKALVELVRRRFGAQVHPRTVERALRRKKKRQ